MVDVTVTAVFHHEGAFAVPALASMRLLVDNARQQGLTIEARAILDRPNAITLELVKQNGRWLDVINEVSFGDLGLARNAGISSALGEYVSFLDGDDLWGEDWLVNAYASASKHPSGKDVIWHPEMLYYFHESDFDRHSTSRTPHPYASSFHFFHRASNENDFDRRALFLENVWSANVFASKKLHLAHPYKAIDKATGFGIEDWSWNIETVWAGIPHLIVPETVHLIRVKQSGSLGQQNAAEGLLPHIPAEATPFSTV